MVFATQLVSDILLTPALDSGEFTLMDNTGINPLASGVYSHS
jgi:hypothetical protein